MISEPRLGLRNNFLSIELEDRSSTLNYEVAKNYISNIKRGLRGKVIDI